VNKYDTLKYSLVKATTVSVHLRIYLCVFKIYQHILYSRSVVAPEGDFYSRVESIVVHLPFIGQVGPGYYGKHPLLVSSLSNVPSWIVEDIAYPSQN
jgi:hypothetical protein